MSISQFIFYWSAASLLVAVLYILTAKGRLYCAALFIGHIYSLLKEEVARPLRVVRRALSRKDLELDEHEEKLS